ncbi:hypothetical protein FNL55_21005 [Tardiphaga sp. vice352]|uniref:hypothetical protein n=1 Tax=unclassified Tardiphaga TaxID=2631404 RepID=UPI0011656E70|nr:MULTISPECIES: hypothetical protein [unclassified Tardiphaga]MBC7586094.1 hypothetical protein [Tardiphaga sp.]QDM18216.1 hypothetical protein FNL53_21515 [Tardiphaga sp. vice278]QDM23222.1 hypothetical protein FIU28_20320 [Tardiphaga sp. vice154]QDM28443.1 hypothetical protein FNL56_21760 [Tardiphaga sp. vice304]QDM33540.1 hypothetical protein FNL55_21005 [Tardiphaga sp. vice352]
MRTIKRHFTLRALLETRANVIRCARRLPVGEKRTQLRRFGIQIRALCRNSTWLNANVIDGPLLPDRKPAAKLPVEYGVSVAIERELQGALGYRPVRRSS